MTSSGILNRRSRLSRDAMAASARPPRWLAAAVWTISLLALPAFAIDPPHVTTNLCSSCHMLHLAAGGDLTTVAGNANLCMSCHQPGGTASTKPFAASDQALPWPGLPAATTATGTSHRWDASAAGHVTFLGGAATPSTGTVLPSGAFAGVYPKTYTLTITTAGAVGTARFNWTATTPGGDSAAGVLTGTSIPLDQGVLVSFRDGAGTSFQTGDQWNLYVRSDLRPPTNAVLLAHTTNGVASCSACHDEHSQALAPFDPAAPAYGGFGTGAGRHFMRLDNSHHQLCAECHAARLVTNSLAGSHPVGIPVPADALHKAPTQLPLEKTSANVVCLTCHKIHFSSSGDAKLLRLAGSVSVCMDCHAQSDTATPASHFVATDNATLWPGGRYGSLLPARTTAADRGTCLNCHVIHGWPDSANPTNHYAKLLADFEENLCFTCHGTNGPAAKRVQADFAKVSHHPVVNAEQVVGRKVECIDCHNPHKALSGGQVYTNTATTARNQVSNPLKGVSGVAVNFSGLANFAAPALSSYTLFSANPGATNEYQICLKCHSAYAWGAGSPPAGRSPNGTSTSPAETDCAQEFSPANRSGHPIVTGLNNYPNSILVGGVRGLTTNDMKAPWNVNLGQQTMTCSDCHGSDAASPAAQGPHGSAAQFILRGPNGNNWPNVTLTSFNSSWCANCHTKGAGNADSPHYKDEHQSFPCYYCHIVIPHGGKVSRLIADNDTMPARYAYNGILDVNNVQAFTKASSSGYQNVNCLAQCHGNTQSPHLNTTPDENW